MDEEYEPLAYDPPVPTLTFIRIPPLYFVFYEDGEDLITIDDLGAVAAAADGLLTYTLHGVPVLYGEYILSIDFGTCYSSPF